jgi:hypothetical protein
MRGFGPEPFDGFCNQRQLTDVRRLRDVPICVPIIRRVDINVLGRSGKHQDRNSSKQCVFLKTLEHLISIQFRQLPVE